MWPHNLCWNYWCSLWMEGVSDSYSTVRNMTDDLISLLARVNYGGFFLFFKNTYSGVMYLWKKCSDHTCTALWLFTYSFMYFSQTEPACVTGILIKKDRSPAMALMDYQYPSNSIKQFLPVFVLFTHGRIQDVLLCVWLLFAQHFCEISLSCCV